MMNELTLPLPLPLPAGWAASRRWENDPNVIIVEWPGHGSVTVDLRKRNFELGVSLVHKGNKTRYTGRGWEARLFSDAFAALTTSRIF
jgi:hypothetical protein